MQTRTWPADDVHTNELHAAVDVEHDGGVAITVTQYHRDQGLWSGGSSEHISIPPYVWEWVMSCVPVAADLQAQTTTTVRAIAEACACALSQQDVQTVLDAVLQHNEAVKLLQRALTTKNTTLTHEIEAFTRKHPIA